MKKNLAKVVTLGLLTASVFVVSGYDNKCLAGDPWGILDSQQVVVENKGVAGSEIGLQDPEIQHEVNGKLHHDGSECEENANRLYIKDVAQIKDTLVENDKKLENKINGVKNDVIKDIKDDAELKAELKGEKGDKGADGEKGDKGEKGEKGEKGDSIASGSYDVKDNVVRMPIVDEQGNPVGNVEIKDIASTSDLAKETAERKAEVSRLDSRIDKLDGRVEKVGAMAAAMASLHTMGYDPAAPTEIAVGVGQYRDKTGFALGAFHYPNKNFMLNVSVSTAGDEFMAGIGATWKIGRRSPEAMLKAEQEKAARQKLAKAEAEKQAAKDARVAAQAARHAKMLAERGL